MTCFLVDQEYMTSKNKVILCLIPIVNIPVAIMLLSFLAIESAYDSAKLFWKNVKNTINNLKNLK